MDRTRPAQQGQAQATAGRVLPLGADLAAAVTGASCALSASELAQVCEQIAYHQRSIDALVRRLRAAAQQDLAARPDGSASQAWSTKSEMDVAPGRSNTAAQPPGAADREGEPELWDIEDVAKYLRRSVRAVRGLRVRGVLPLPDGPGRRLLWRAEKIRQCGVGRVSSRAPKRSPR